MPSNFMNWREEGMRQALHYIAGLAIDGREDGDEYCSIADDILKVAVEALNVYGYEKPDVSDRQGQLLGGN